MGWFENMLDDKTIKKSVNASLNRVVDELITPDYVHNIQRDMFKEKPNQPLTKVGFEMAMALALQDVWPSMSVQECGRVMREDLRTAGIKYGDKDYLWTASAAKELAVEYSKAYGETAGA